MFIIGALLSRLHGSTWLPYKILKSLLWALPFAITTHIFLGWWSVLVLAGCSLAKSTGHGCFMDLGTWQSEDEDERLEFIIKPLEGKIPTYYYDVLGLSITGLASVLAFSISISFVNPLYGLISVIGGALKPVGYMLGLKIYPKHFTEIGELNSGAFAYLVLDVIIMEML